jgi:hypothetical protein
MVWNYEFTICKGVLGRGSALCILQGLYQPHIYGGLVQVYKLGPISSPVLTENYLMFFHRIMCLYLNFKSHDVFSL